MQPQEFIEQSILTESKTFNYEQFNARILHAAMGAVTEAGEMMDQLKKSWFYNKPLDKVNIKEEAGDLLWYIAILCHELDIQIEDLFDGTIAKLRKRFPNNYTDYDAHYRNLESERMTLEEKYADEQMPTEPATEEETEELRARFGPKFERDYQASNRPAFDYGEDYPEESMKG